ncbi:CRISPR-associated endonuclease Cas1 [Laribacter hongkongensis]|uniref:CRISPR-associated endonuclease Cas1 n=1 Tax=Laribacter hongkongensis TaxID=168471 RepID=UPI001EFD9585|nr:CRISPR-associated endonuclease Cas1 [Laribacter hongkongensis]MCG9084137.1 CRISPR-associated endonuclease Cas1 [Laribacter hongkongensis]
MSTLYIDKKGLQLDIDGAAIILREHGKMIGTLPLGPVERIFIRGEVLLPARLLARLGELGIGLVLLAGWHSKPTLFLPRAHHDAQRRLRQAQHYSHPDYRREEARLILATKLDAQISQLDASLIILPEHRYPLHHALRQLRAMQETLSHQPDLPALLGWEGAAARIYYRALGAIFPEWTQFSGRNRRPPRDPVNVLLSLAYTLLHAEAVLAAHGAGLDPDIGMLHALEVGRASLGCDLIEPLRPQVDQWIAHALREDMFGKDDFRTETDACHFEKAPRLRFYAAWETVMPAWRTQLQALARALLVRMEQRLCVV